MCFGRHVFWPSSAEVETEEGGDGGGVDAGERLVEVVLVSVELEAESERADLEAQVHDGAGQ